MSRVSRISRRSMLKIAAVAAGGAALAACGATPTPTPTLVPPTATRPPVPPTAVPAAPAPPAATAVPPTATPVPPTATKPPAPAATPVPTKAPAKPVNLYSPTAADWCSATTLAIRHIDQVNGNRLVAMSPDFSQIINDLAESWEASKDGLTFTFKLRKNVKFHDGHPFTAQDVLFTYNRIAEPKIASWQAGYFVAIKGYSAFKDGKADKVEGFKVVDDYTFQVTLEKFDAIFVKKLAYITIVPEHLLKDVPVADYAKDKFWTETRIMTGPFKWVKYVPDQYVEMDAFADYYAGKPKLDKLFFRLFKTYDPALLAVQSGEIDNFSIHGIPIDQVDTFKKNPNLVVVPVPSYTANHIAINYKTVPAFSDKRVRQAMRYAIDVDTMLKDYWKGNATPLYATIVQPWATAPDLNKYAYNVEKAKSLLKDANWDASKEYELAYYYADEFNKNLVAVLQQYLAAVGIKIKPRLVDSPTASQIIYTDKTFQLAYMGYGMPIDPDELSNQLGRSAAQNFAGYDNAQLKDLLDKGASTLDQAERTKTYYDVTRLLNEEMPYVALWTAVRPEAYNKRLGDFEPYIGPRNIMPYYAAPEKWYLK